MDSWNIDSEKLREKIKSRKEGKFDFDLVDVREPDENAEGAIEGSKLIPLGDIETRCKMELSPTRPVVVYCAHGIRSLEALMILKTAGFQEVWSLEGGFVAWNEPHSR